MARRVQRAPARKVLAPEVLANPADARSLGAISLDRFSIGRNQAAEPMRVDPDLPAIAPDCRPIDLDRRQAIGRLRVRLKLEPLGA